MGLKMCILIFSAFRIWNIYHSRRNWAGIWLKMYISLPVKYPLFLSCFNETWISQYILEKYSNIKRHTKNRPVGAELFHADGQTGWHDEVNSRCSQYLRTRLEKITQTVFKNFCPEYNLALFQISGLLLMYLHQLPNGSYNLQWSL